MGDIVQRFTTEADTSGIDDIKGGLSDVTDATSRASQSMGSSFDMSGSKFENLAHRIARPIEVIAFSGVANELSGLGEKGETAGQMIEKGLHAAGSALMFFNPILGISVIGATALYEAFKNLGDLPTADNLKKQLESAQAEKEAFSSSAKELLKLGVIREADADQLKKMASASQEEIDKEKEHIKTLVAEEAANLASTKARVEGNRWLNNTAQGLKEIAEAQDHYNAILKASTAISEFQIKTDKEAEKSKPKDDSAVMEKLTQLQIQNYISKRNLSQVTKELTSDTKLLAGLEAAELSTTDVKEIAMLQKKIEFMKQVIAAENQQVEDLKPIAQKQDEILDSMTRSWTTYAQSIGTALVQGSTQGKSVLQQMMDDQLKIVGDGLIKQLSAKIAANLSDPLTVGVALAEIAAISAVEAITGASGASSSASSSTASSQPISTQQTNVMVNLQGASLSDPGAVAVIMKGINKQVSQNNGQVVTTKIVGNGVPPPGLLA